MTALLTSLVGDFRYAVRGFTQRPLFAFTVVVTLALGIGANVAVFSLYDRLMLRELPVESPRELVRLVVPGLRVGGNFCSQQGVCEETFSYPMFRDLESAGEPYVDLAASRTAPVSIGANGATVVGSAVLVSGGYFGALGVGPALGRALGEADLVSPPTTVMLSHEYWTTEFGADPSVLGATLRVGGQPLEIVGVAPRGFVGTTPGERTNVFAPLTLEWLQGPVPTTSVIEDRFFYYLYVFGRLRPGVMPEQAEQVLNAAHRGIVEEVETPGAAARFEGASRAADIEAFRTRTLSLQSAARGQSQAMNFVRAPLGTLFAATATILLIACVNLANLMLARGVARSGEIAIRASLGAGRRRLFGLLAVEAFTLAGLAAVASLPVALGVLRGVGLLEPPGVDARTLALDLRAVGVAFAIAGGSAVVFALVPMRKLLVAYASGALSSSGMRALGGKNVGRFRFVLAATQIALSMALLVLTALFTQSLANIARVDLGLRTESVVSFMVAPGLNGYTRERQEQVFDAIERELLAYPGVTAVASSGLPLLAGSDWNSSVAIEGFEPATPAESSVNVNQVGPDFFRTLDIALLAGRAFAATDTRDSPRVAIVNKSFAERFGLGADPIGKRVGFDPRGPLDIEIVGLVADSAYNSVKEPFVAQVLTPRAQSRGFAAGATFYVRAAGAAEPLLAVVPRLVARVDSNLPVMDVTTFASQVRRNVRQDWLLVALAGTLATIATLLAALGLYGVLSYMLAQRTREIGLRLALGAEPANVSRMVLRQVGWMVAIGLPIGLGLALSVGQLAATQLFGLTPTDPLAALAAAGVLAAAVLGAAYGPARRAARIEPAMALRAE